MKQYVIGDVHGYYQTVLSLAEKLPGNAELIFVGDLIDRGPQSSEVIRFVREGGHRCVMGNHEAMMVESAPAVMEALQNGGKIDPDLPWCSNGGLKTLASYGLVDAKGNALRAFDETEIPMRRFQADVAWLKRLPFYLELGRYQGKNVVVSHACVTRVWHLRLHDKKRFNKEALWTRVVPDAGRACDIFNVFGHTPVTERAGKGPCHVNIDTGCYREKPAYGRLSAYDIETAKVISVDRVEREAFDRT